MKTKDIEQNGQFFSNIAKYNLTNVNIYFRLFNFYYETARANFITLHGFKSLKILKP